MIEWPLVLAAGLLGSGHCVGMCGPIVLALGGAAPRAAEAARRQLAYTAGRVFTYAALGAGCGFAGAKLAHWAPAVARVPALLALAAGLLLTWQGLQAVGWWPKRATAPGAGPCLGASFLGEFLRQPGAHGAFLAGVFTGLLPCGLLYGMLALAGSTHDVLGGALTMALFALGTAPALVALGVGGRLLGLGARQWLLRIAAWCLVLTGVVSIARGVSFLAAPGEPERACPMCQWKHAAAEAAGADAADAPPPNP